MQRLKELENIKQFLRVSVDSGGCSGFEYKFALDSNITAEDKYYKIFLCKIYIYIY